MDGSVHGDGLPGCRRERGSCFTEGAAISASQPTRFGVKPALVRCRTLLLLVSLSVPASTALADETAAPTATPAPATSKPDGKSLRAEALREDLRFGHIFLSLGGGLWVPSASFVPSGIGLTAPGVGGDARLRLGLGLNGYLVGFAEGSFARAQGQSGCTSCSATSLSAGVGVSAHLSQGFAVDPWISYGVAYRDTLLTVDKVPFAVSDAPVHGIDFARVALGFEHAPVPWLGMGPYVGTDVGVRIFDGAVYGDFVVGLRVVFDPKQAGKKLTIDASR